jgi:DNA helicase HerA-like ATPase
MATLLERLQAYNLKGRPQYADSVHIGTVVSMDDVMMDNIHEFYLPNADRPGHFGCLGTTRVGKTKLLTHMICQDIKMGNNVVFLDPKGDDEAMSAIVEAAIKAGRLDARSSSP